MAPGQRAPKLSLYAKGRSHNKSMIETFGQQKLEQAFCLHRFLSQRDHASALKPSKPWKNKGEEAPYIFAMMARQIRLLLEVKALRRTPKRTSNCRQMGAHPLWSKYSP